MFADTTREVLPAWYELEVRSDGKALVIHVHEKAMEFLVLMLRHDSRVVKNAIKRYEINDYISPSNGAYQHLHLAFSTPMRNT